MSYTFRGKALPAKSTTDYINLATNRAISDMKRKGFLYVDVSKTTGAKSAGPGPLVTGEAAIVQEFLNENGLTLAQGAAIAPASPAPKRGKAGVPPSPAAPLSGMPVLGLPAAPPAAGLPSLALPGLPSAGRGNILPGLPGLPPMPLPAGLGVIPIPSPILPLAGGIPSLPGPPMPALSGPGIHALPALPGVVRSAVLPALPLAGGLPPPTIGLAPFAGVAAPAPPPPPMPNIGMCMPGTAGGAVFTNTNVRNIPDATINNLCHFHLSGLRGEGKVILSSEGDGDTIPLLLHVPLVGLLQPIPVGKKKEMKAAAFIAPSLPVGRGGAGFWSLFKSRLNGVDAAEIAHSQPGTHQGVIAKLLMCELFASLGSYVYYRTGMFDKYGRLLVELFADAEYKTGLNRRFVGYEWHGPSGFELPEGQREVVLGYNGGTKAVYMSTLPKYRKAELDAYEQRLLEATKGLTLANFMKPIPADRKAPAAEKDGKHAAPEGEECEAMEVDYDADLAEGKQPAPQPLVGGVDVPLPLPPTGAEEEEDDEEEEALAILGGQEDDEEGEGDEEDEEELDF